MKVNTEKFKLSKDNLEGIKKLNISIANKKKDMQQKVDVITDVIKTIKNNPKFIKLLIYSMNSLENFVSPPNRQIRINARIIIKCKSIFFIPTIDEGVGTLKAIAQINITKNEIVEVK